MWRILKKMFIESLQDPKTKRFSQARIIAMLVAFAATIFMWKLIILGGMSIDYFMAYLAFGSGHQAMNKFLDGKNSKHDKEDSH